MSDETMNTVDTESIDYTVDYIKESWTEPLFRIGENIIQSYKDIERDGIKNDEITKSILDQQQKINEMRTQLDNIFKHARGNMEDSNAEIKKEQAAINDEMTI